MKDSKDANCQAKAEVMTCPKSRRGLPAILREHQKSRAARPQTSESQLMALRSAMGRRKRASRSAKWSVFISLNMLLFVIDKLYSEELIMRLWFIPGQHPLFLLISDFVTSLTQPVDIILDQLIFWIFLFPRTF